MSYLVFARKYRPQTFTEVIGQEHVARTLLSALEGGRLAHAYLFAGPRGVGKTTMARILAKAINCLASPGASPCGSCDACRGIAAGHDVDVLEIDAASHRKVEHVEPLIDASRYLPQRSVRKIFIVDEAHQLSRTAWNALLKTLEEPPAHVLFVFCTTEPQKVIETVRSRCQEFDFRRITPDDIEGKLRRIVADEGLSAEPELLHEIAVRSTGGLRDAETLLDQVASAAKPGATLGLADLAAVAGDTAREARLAILGRAHSGEMAAALEAAAGAVDAGADPAGLLRDLLADLHDAAVARARGEEGELGLEWCLAAAELAGRHLALADRSRAPRAALDLALLAMARLGDVADLESLVERLERLAGSSPTPAASSLLPPSSKPRPPTPPPVQAARPDLRRNLQELQRRAGNGDEAGTPPPPEENLEEAGEAPLNERPRPAPSRALSSSELARIRNLPRVKEVLSVFGGRIEQVRRSDNG